MKTVSLKCPQCGATMTLNESQNEAGCSYCGYKMIIKKERTEDEKRRFIEDISYAKELGKQQAQKEQQAQKTKRFALTMAVIAIVVSLGFVFIQNLKPEIDPFDYVEISFSGIDGQGKANISLLNGKDDIDATKLEFDISPSKDLSQNDYVTVTVSSNSYRLTYTSKKYQVEGLQQYVTDLTSLSKKQRKLLYDENTELQQYNLSAAYADVEWSSIEPVKMCLLSDGNKISKVFIISTVTGSYEDVSKTHYLVSEMDDVVATDQGLSFGSSQYLGNLSGSVNENGRGFIYSYSSLDAAVSAIQSTDASLTYSELS